MKTILYFATVTSLLSLSCTKNNVHPSDSSLTDSFPNKVGDQWVYKVTDSLKNITDTVTVTITGTLSDPISGRTFTVWQYQWPDKTDTQYVSIIADTIRFYYQLNNPVIANVYIFPLIVNNTYSSNSYFSFGLLDNLKVLSSFTSTITLGSVIQQVPTFQVEKMFLTPYASPIRRFYVITDNFAPDIGIIKQTLNNLVGEVGKEMTTNIETWELVYWHLI